MRAHVFMMTFCGVLLPFSPCASAGDLWKTGESTFMLESTDNSGLRLTFNDVKDDFVKEGVQRGALVFDGTGDGSHVTGTGSLYRKDCGHVEYAVTGLYDLKQGVIFLAGSVPAQSKPCKIDKPLDIVLRFTWVEDKPQPLAQSALPPASDGGSQATQQNLVEIVGRYRQLFEQKKSDEEGRQARAARADELRRRAPVAFSRWVVKLKSLQRNKLGAVSVELVDEASHITLKNCHWVFDQSVNQDIAAGDAGTKALYDQITALEIGKNVVVSGDIAVPTEEIFRKSHFLAVNDLTESTAMASPTFCVKFKALTALTR